MEVTFNVDVTAKDMRGYMFTHKYRSVSGILEVLIGIACLVVGLLQYGKIEEQWKAYMLILIFFGAFFLVFTPLNLCFKAKKQIVLNPMFKEPFTYVLNEEGIYISQNGESDQLPWKDVYKIVKNSTGIIIYISKYRANILPQRCIAEKETDIVKVIKNYAGKEKIGYGLRD